MTRPHIWGWLAKEFTFGRWSSNPFQMWQTTCLGIWSVWQMLVGVTPNGTLDVAIDHHAQTVISGTNLLGAFICLFGLHLRDDDTGLWVEVVGYLSLIGTLAIYIGLVGTTTTYFNTAYGYGLTIGFIGAGVFRTVQVFALKRAEMRAERLRKIVAGVDQVIISSEHQEAEGDG